MTSPRTPQDVLRRVIRISRLNGWSVAIFAVLATLVSLAFGDPVGASVCIVVGLGGVFEVRGQRMLTHRDGDGMRWLIRGQWVVLGVIWAYGVSRLMSYDPELVREMASSEIRSMLDEYGLTLEDILPLVRKAFYLLYGSLIVITGIYQGGMVLYYRKHTATVEAALRAPPTISARPPEDFAI